MNNVEIIHEDLLLKDTLCVVIYRVFLSTFTAYLEIRAEKYHRICSKRII